MIKMKAVKAAKMNIGVLADTDKRIWYYHGLLNRGKVDAQYGIDLTLSKNAETILRIMSFTHGGFDILIIDFSRIALKILLDYILKKNEEIVVVLGKSSGFEFRHYKNGEIISTEVLGDSNSDFYNKVIEILDKIFEVESSEKEVQTE